MYSCTTSRTCRVLFCVFVCVVGWLRKHRKTGGARGGGVRCGYLLISCSLPSHSISLSLVVQWQLQQRAQSCRSPTSGTYASCSYSALCLQLRLSISDSRNNSSRVHSCEHALKREAKTRNAAFTQICPRHQPTSRLPACLPAFGFSSQLTELKLSSRKGTNSSGRDTAAVSRKTSVHL